MLKLYAPKQGCNYVQNVIHFCDQGKNSTHNTLKPLLEGKLYRYLIQ